MSLYCCKDEQSLAAMCIFMVEITCGRQTIIIFIISGCKYYTNVLLKFMFFKKKLNNLFNLDIFTASPKSGKRQK